jgi:two-component system OmpR family response regulator
MQIFVVGMRPLPWRFFEALHVRYSVAVYSLLKNPLRVTDNTQRILLIWAEKISLLFLKKFLVTAEQRFPLLVPVVLGGGFSSRERAEILRAGARECLPQTVSTDELVTRIMLLTGEHLSAPAHFQQGDFLFTYGEHIASYKNVRIPLNKKEALLLEALLKASPKLVAQPTLISHVWSDTEPPSSNSLEVYMSRLRRKIEKSFGLKLFETVKGIGYRVQRKEKPAGLTSRRGETGGGQKGAVEQHPQCA